MIQFRVLLWVIVSYNLPLVKPNVIPLLKELVTSQKLPLQVIFQTCWSPEEDLTFFKYLSENFPISFGRTFDHLDRRSVIVTDLACPNLQLISEKKDPSNLQRIYFSSNDDLVGNTEFLKVTKMLNLTVVSKVLRVIKSIEGYEVKSVFRYTSNGPLIEEFVGSWRNGTLFLERSPKRSLHQAVNLTAAIVCYSLEHQTATKVNVELTKQLAFLLNVSIRFECFNDWDAILRHDHVDLIATPTYMTPERLDQVRFLAMTGPLDYKFIFRAPKLSYTDNVFAVAFHSRVWLSILGILLLATLLQVIIIRVDHSMVQPANPHDNGIAGVLLSMISIASQQEVLIASRSISTRTLSVVMLISLMFLYICFSANIVGLIQTPSPRIRTLDDLRRSGMELTMQDDPINRISIGNQTNRRSFVPLKEGADRIRAGLYAFHGDTNLIYSYMVDHYREGEKCNLQAINQLIPLNGYYSMPKDSLFTDFVKVGLLTLRERGFQSRHVQAHYTGKPPCLGEAVFDPIAMVDALFAMQLMGVAAGGLAPVILALELLEKRYGVGRRIWAVGRDTVLSCWAIRRVAERLRE